MYLPDRENVQRATLASYHFLERARRVLRSRTLNDNDALLSRFFLCQLLDERLDMELARAYTRTETSSLGRHCSLDSV